MKFVLGATAALVLGWGDAESAAAEAEAEGAAKLASYFEKQVSVLEGQLDREVKTKEDWEAKKGEYRRQLASMLGLAPLPDRTDLKVTKTGEFEQDGVVVENLHYQSLPGLYVTANLYRPKTVQAPLPTVLYVCGHAVVMKDGVSYGNKTGYEHHGMWYAKHGFVCLIIDTVQLGEIRGEHHGTYRFGRWWWMSRGYTPAGVEAWAGIRGLDYLETRPEVDKSKFGVTGRSGGGGYSWYIAALDERIACAAPTAGITTLRNHIVDGCVAGHCDCMFFANTYRWDYDKLAALVAPRPLLVVNTDKDPIFPIDGVFNLYQSVRRVYKLLGAEKNIGLQVSEGPHKDMQPLHMGEFHWMQRFLQGTDLMGLISVPAAKSVPAEKLRVFQELPKDERNTRIDESFVAAASAPPVPGTQADWASMRNRWMQELTLETFAGWEALKGGESGLGEPSTTEAEGIVMKRWDLPHNELLDPVGSGGLYLLHGAAVKPENLDLVVLNVLDEEGWRDFVRTYASRFGSQFDKAVATDKDDKSFEQEKRMFGNFKWGMAYVCPRGIGPTAWMKVEVDHPQPMGKEETHLLRRFYLLGQTLHGQQVWDIRTAIASIKGLKELGGVKLWVQASRIQAGNALYASLYEDGITRLDLHDLPASHQTGPIYLNVLRHLDLPQAAAMAAERTRVIIYANDQAPWQFTKEVADKLEWGKDKKAGLQLREIPVSSKE